MFRGAWRGCLVSASFAFNLEDLVKIAAVIQFSFHLIELYKRQARLIPQRWPALFYVLSYYTRS